VSAIGLGVFSPLAFAQYEGKLKTLSANGLFEGNITGSYSILSNATISNITAAMNMAPHGDNIFKAWLANNQTQQNSTDYISLGVFDNNNKISVGKPAINLTPVAGVQLLIRPIP
jgi:hypothetical protein